MDTELLNLLLPAGLLDYFDIEKINKNKESINIYLVEKNTQPEEYSSQKLISKGFFEEESVRDFPLCGFPCFLKLKRRKWLNQDTGKIVYRDWNLVANGTRMTSEFAFFLKGAFR